MIEYLAMGGYAAYVWSAFGIALALMAGLFVQSRQAARRREVELEQLRAHGPAPARPVRPMRAVREADAAARAPAKAAELPRPIVPSMRLRKRQRLALVVLALLSWSGGPPVWSWPR